MTEQAFQHSEEQQRRYRLILALVVLLLGSVYPFVLRSDFRGSGDLHTVTTIFGGLLALISGLVLVAHFYSLGDRILLFLGLAFFLAAVMDLTGGLMTFGDQHGWFGGDWHGFERHTATLYISGRLLMGGVLAAAPWLTSRMGLKAPRRSETMWVLVTVLSLSVAAAALLSWLEVHRLLWLERGIVGRPVDALLSLLFAVALLALLREYGRSRDKLVWWVMLSVGVAAAAHLLKSFSRTPFDASHNLALAYMTIAYTVPIVGFPLCQISASLERRQAMYALQRQRSLFRTVLNNTPDLIALKDIHFIYQAANRAFCRFVGKSESDVVGRTDFDLFDEDLAKEYRRNDQDVLRRGKAEIQDEKIMQMGLTKWFHVLRAPVRDSEDNLVAVLSSVRDITEIKRMEHQLRIMSHTDDLTGLHNRRGFFVLGEQLLRTASRKGWHVLLVFADLDKMKSINDAFGHEGGDAALKDAAAILKRTFRGSDVIARIGGDEFAVIVADTEATVAEMLTGRLRENVRVHNETAGRPYEVSFSVGVVPANPSEGTAIDPLLSRADALMYEQKRAKRREDALTETPRPE